MPWGWIFAGIIGDGWPTKIAKRIVVRWCLTFLRQGQEYRVSQQAVGDSWLENPAQCRERWLCLWDRPLFPSVLGNQASREAVLGLLMPEHILLLSPRKWENHPSKQRSGQNPSWTSSSSHPGTDDEIYLHLILLQRGVLYLREKLPGL